MKEKNELKLDPCSLCGHDTAVIPLNSSKKFMGIVKCSHCGYSTKKCETQEEAIALWHSMYEHVGEDCMDALDRLHGFGRYRVQKDTSRISGEVNSKDALEELIRIVKEQARIENAQSIKKMWNGKKRNCDVYVDGRDALMDFMIANPKYGKPDNRMSYFTPFFAFVEWLWSPYEGDKEKEVKEALGEK